MRAPLGPAVRRGLLTSIPVGAALLVDLELDSAVAGAVSTGAFLAGFVAFEAPPVTRARWQVLTAPAIGAAAALGALTGDSVWLAVPVIAIVSACLGLSGAVSRRLAVAALNVVLALLLAQGLGVEPSQAPEALLLGGAGAASQALLSLLGLLWNRQSDDPESGPDLAGAVAALRASLTPTSPMFRHALRWGIALGVGTAVYNIVDLGPHGYWIPLTILFVLRPTPGETAERIAMRAAGTVAGIAVAIAIAGPVDDFRVAEAVVISIAAGLAFALLAIEYALFTTAITAYIVLVTHALGQSAFEAADERAVATAAGLGIVVLLVLVWDRPGALTPRRAKAGPGEPG
jgi:Fusaric acid resistance protein-like